MNLYEGKGFNKAGVCDWLPLYYHAGMYRVPYCYIALNCDKERLGYFKQEPDITKLACTVLPWIDFLAQFLSKADLRARNYIIVLLGGGARSAR